MSSASAIIALVELTRLASVMSIVLSEGREPTDLEKQSVKNAVKRANDLWEQA